MEISNHYESIKQIVLQVIEERERQTKSYDSGDSHKEMQRPGEKKEEDLLMEFDENAMNDILASIAAFREQ